MTITSDATIPGLILAGGRSSRMGENKALMQLGGDTVIGHVVRRIAPQVSKLAINAQDEIPGLGLLRHVPDRIDGQLGPLAGILTGMRHFAQTCPDATHFASVPCDSPFLPLDLVSRLVALKPDRDTIVTAASLGRNHPVFALWPVALADALERFLAEDDKRRINGFLARHHTVTVDFQARATAHGPLDLFLNINTPDDMVEAGAFAELVL